MATAIELVALATRETTTKSLQRPDGTFAVQPYESDTETAETAADLDGTAADERAVNLTLAWEYTDNGDSRLCMPALEVVLEASADQVAWLECARFPVVHLGAAEVGSHALGFVAPHRYLKTRHTIRATSPRKQFVRFSVAGKKS